MRLTVATILFVLAVPCSATAADKHDKAGHKHDYVAAALAAPARKEDAADDERRHAAAIMAFAEVKPGQKVLELVPGSGYWTRMFSAIVGPKGHVFTVWPKEMEKYAVKSLATWKDLIAAGTYANVTILEQPAATLSVAQPVDVVFTSQNYHDYYDKFMGPVDIATFNKQVMAALKPGGVFVIIDHTAQAGSGTRDTDSLHRIDPEVVKKDLKDAGFVFDGSSDALHNAADPLTAKVFDPAIRGHTDQFVYRFRKPAK